MISTFPNRILRSVTAAMIIAFTGMTTPVHAATTINVTVNWDTLQADYLCSLREAIIAANTDTAVDVCPAGNGMDTIVVPAGWYELTLPGINENAAQTGDLDITEDVIIIGGGNGITTISGNRSDRVFEVIGASVVELSGMRITNGLVGAASSGGGISNVSGTLTLTDSSVDGNTSSDGHGGGIFNEGTLTILNSNVDGNTAEYNGGGIGNAGTVTLTDSTLSGNIASFGEGGGVYNTHMLYTGSAATLIITNSTVDGNTAIEGGGIYNEGVGDYGENEGTITFTNGTLSGNSATDDGGGIHNQGTATFTNSTISGNDATNDGGGISNYGLVKLHNVTVTNNTADLDGDNLGDGGGVFVSTGSTLNLGNSIIADNFDNSIVTRQPDCSGYLTSLGYNLIQKLNGCALAGVKGNLLRVQPLLGPLQDNGGTTWTHALLIGSPAIDAGNPSGCKDGDHGVLTTDQRGNVRPLDGNGDATVICDMGAFEYLPAP